MKDFLGQEIHIDDEVVIAPYKFNDLYKGKIIKIMSKMVDVEVFIDSYSYGKLSKSPTRIDSNKVIVIKNMATVPIKQNSNSDDLWKQIISFIEDHRGWDELQFTEEEIEKYSLLKFLELPEYEYDHFYMDRALKCIIQGIFNVCISCRFGNEEFSLSAIIDGKLYHYHNAYYTAD